MERQKLTDGTPRWFDLDRAERFDQATTWDGSHESMWAHETLYKTAKGGWVKHFRSQYPVEGQSESWTILEPDEAHTWLGRNGYGEGASEDFAPDREV